MQSPAGLTLAYRKVAQAQELRLSLSQIVLKARSAPGENKIKTNTKSLYYLLVLPRGHELSNGPHLVLPRPFPLLAMNIILLQCVGSLR